MDGFKIVVEVEGIHAVEEFRDGVILPFAASRSEPCGKGVPCFCLREENSAFRVDHPDEREQIAFVAEPVCDICRDLVYECGYIAWLSGA